MRNRRLNGFGIGFGGLLPQLSFVDRFAVHDPSLHNLSNNYATRSHRLKKDKVSTSERHTSTLDISHIKNKLEEQMVIVKYGIFLRINSRFV